jgi:uncharacterized lipoprotein YmbA
MKCHLAVVLAPGVLAIWLAGCTSTPAHLYTLNPTAMAPASDDLRLPNIAVVLGPISIPGIVDLQQIVVSNSANQVSVDEFNRWASPLRNNISLVVADNISVLLGTPNVSSALTLTADYRVAIEVQSFESTPGDSAHLSALWTVRRVKDGATATGRTTTRETSSDQGYGALAAAHSRCLGRLSTDIAEAIRALDRSPLQAGLTR